MSSRDQAVQIYLTDIQKKTGQTLPELAATNKDSGLIRHIHLTSRMII